VINLIGHTQNKSSEKKISEKEEKQFFEKKESKTEEKPESKQKEDAKQEEINKLTELVQRIQAEFENFRKREEKERKHFIEFSNSGLIADLLPVLDSIDSAKKNTGQEEKKGIELIEKQLNSVLGKYGLKEIECIGKKFNPEFHECLIKENNSEKEDNIVLEELQKGFMLKDKVLRHSKVKINSVEEKKEERKKEEKENE